MDTVDALNFHHLRYFWAVARDGSLVAAGKKLRLSHSTLSAQIRALEDHLGAELFTRVGRKLVLTESGQGVFRFANEIFSLGRDLVESVHSDNAAHAPRLDVGVVDVVPKTVVRRLLVPALQQANPVRIVCHEGSYDRLLADLALHKIDLMIADAPVPDGSPVRAFSSLLGRSAVTIFGTATLAETLKGEFPGSLDGAPMLLPLEGLVLRRNLDEWFARHKVRPRVVGEFEDSALLKAFGSAGIGLFPAPTAVAAEVKAQYGVADVGVVDVEERYFLVTAERRVSNPAIVAITEAAKRDMLQGTRSSTTRVASPRQAVTSAVPGRAASRRSPK